jgi:U3 small nucleolar ribonucleoprotein protein IMP4
MLVTSSRKPSARTRILCKYLASFFNCDYINRGKLGLEELCAQVVDTLLVTGDYHGNPGSLNFYSNELDPLLSIKFTLSDPDQLKYSHLRSTKPVISGSSKLSCVLSQITGLPVLNDDDFPVYLKVNEKSLEFNYYGKQLFCLKIIKYRSFLEETL